MLSKIKEVCETIGSILLTVLFLIAVVAGVRSVIFPAYTMYKAVTSNVNQVETLVNVVGDQSRELKELREFNSSLQMENQRLHNELEIKPTGDSK